MTTWILCLLMTGAWAAEIAGAGKIARPADIGAEAHFPLSRAVLADLGLPKALAPNLQNVMDAKLDALPDFAKLPESDVEAQSDWIRGRVRARIEEAVAKTEAELPALKEGAGKGAPSAIEQLERRKAELKDLLAVSVLAPDAGDVLAARQRVKDTLRQARQAAARKPETPAAASLGGASSQVQRAAEAATAKAPDVARAAAVANRVVDDASSAAAIMPDLKSSGLHAFRTSLRKLLTVLDMLDLAPGARSALNGMFSTAGNWRDAQVKAQWLGDSKKADGESPERVRELRRWQKQFESIAAELKPALQKIAEAPADERKALSDKVRRTILDQAARVSRQLSAVRGENDSHGLHSARLSIKKLGDLIEAFTGESPAPVRQLQDLLGGIHDRDMLLESLPASDAESIARARAERRKLLDQLYGIGKP